MRVSYVAVAVVVALGAAAGRGEACSMCRCGDPTFNLVGSQVFGGQAWHVGLDADRYAKDQVSDDSPDVFESEVENRYTLSASRTFGGRVMVIGRLPIAHRTITTGEESSSLSGLSNPEVLVNYQVISPSRGSWLSASLGVLTPWGLSNGQQDGQRAEEHLQPSTGAGSLAPGLSFAHVLGAGRNSSLYGSVLGRFNGRNDAEYHYGNAVLANLGYERNIVGRLNGVLEANFRHAAKDEPTASEEDPNTGGTMLYLTPRVLVRLQDSLYLRVGVQIPVVKDLYGIQKEKVNLQTGLTVRF